MKAGLRALLAVLLLAGVVTAAWGAEDDWRINVRTDDNLETEYFPVMDSYYGVYPSSSDGYDTTAPIQDEQAVFPWPREGYEIDALCTAIIDGDTTMAYRRDIKAPFAPPPAKVWDLRVYAFRDATYANIRLQFFSVSSTLMPPGASAAMHLLKMVDNRGVANASANGTTWEIEIPDAFASDLPYNVREAGTTNWTTSVLLPRLSLNVPDQFVTYADVNAQGYAMQYIVTEPVPEPSGLIALACGLAGLTGVMWRRRP